MNSNHPPAKDHSPPLLLLAAWILLTVSFSFRAVLIFIRYFETDEMFHLNAAFLLSRNWLPYRDFMGNHTPLLHFMLAPLFWLGESTIIIFLSRIIMFALTIILFYLTYRLARLLFNGPISWISISWLALVFIFFEKSLEVRPDIPGMITFMWGILLLSADENKHVKKKWWWAGVLFSISLLFCNKIVFPLLGTGVSLAYILIREAATKSNCKKPAFKTGLLLSGFLLPVAGCLIYFTLRGGARELIYYNTTIHASWISNRSPYVFVRRLAFQNPFFFFWGIWGWLGAGIGIFSGRDTRPVNLLTWSACLTGLTGIHLIPVPNPQYYLLLIPLFIIYAASGLYRFGQWMSRSGFPRKLAGAALLLISGPGLAWVIYGVFDHVEPQYWEDPRFMLPIFTGAVLFGALLLAMARGSKTLLAGLSFLILLIAARPINFLRHYTGMRNTFQLRTIETILEETTSDDRIMEGWPIVGLFRFPTNYYWYLPSMLLSALPSDEKGEIILKNLTFWEPRIITRGNYLDKLSPEVQEYIRNHYVEHPENPCPCLLVRK